MYTIVGLGNPGEEYTKTRHNTGRMVLEAVRKANDLPEWELDKKISALVSRGKIGKTPIILAMPETFMNKSGNAVGKLISSVKKAENLIVVHDDLDLGVGTMKISFNRGSGGHKGLESIIKTIKTQAFTRVRIGISPTTPKGMVKKPIGEKIVGDFILVPFKKSEDDTMKKVFKKAAESIASIVSESREMAMNKFN